MIIRLTSALLRRTLIVFAVLSAAFCAFGSSEVHAETRTLKLYYVHTGEKAEITFKRNGRYDKKGLEELNVFLRDWRHNEPTKMDPRLFDLVWEVYQKTGSKNYITVVSAYRSPATNNMLRKKTKGVAKNSQHMLGKAMDFYIPGVPLKKLREIAMKMQGGGVGYYPNSGSPFVHLDVASVRAWPRMNRSQLSALFPKGGTLHIPSDGKPLPGYSEALAQYKAKGTIKSSGDVRVASVNKSDEKKRPNLFARLFGNKKSNDSNERPAPVRKATPAPQRPVDILTAAVSFDDLDIPLPLSRPSAVGVGLGTPLATALVDPNPSVPVASIDVDSNVPLPMSRPATFDSGNGISVADVLVAEAASPVQSKPTDYDSDIAALSAQNKPFHAFEGDAPIPSPRTAYAEFEADDDVNAPGVQFTFASARVPMSDKRKQAHRELKSKLAAMGEGLESPVNDGDDFRSQFMPTTSRLDTKALKHPVKTGRSIEPLLASLQIENAPSSNGFVNIKNKKTKRYVNETEPLVKSNAFILKDKSVLEKFDVSRF